MDGEKRAVGFTFLGIEIASVISSPLTLGVEDVVVERNLEI